MRSLYVINYLGGTSGTFITAISTMMLLGDHDTKLVISKYGDAHENGITVSNQKRMIRTPEHMQLFRKIIPRSTSQPFVLQDHGKIREHEDDLQYLKKYYPDFLVIQITYDTADLPRIAFNLLIKVMGQRYLMGEKGPWLDVLKKHPLDRDIVSPTDLTQDELKKYILSFLPPVRNSFNNVCTMPGFENNFVYLSFEDILTNRDKTLAFLEKVLEKPINDNIIFNYDAYIKKQQEVIESMAPWILKFEQEERAYISRILSPENRRELLIRLMGSKPESIYNTHKNLYLAYTLIKELELEIAQLKGQT